ncbi:MAG: hypothetical protein F4164_02840 [Gemmatimonadales bacterium]|nr:hypothetical protein [Gemmatimonadales bacterium]
MAPFLVGNRVPTALGEIPPAYRDWTHAPSPAVAVWPYFEDPDGDSLTFIATTDDPEVLDVRVVDGFVEVDAIGSGVAMVTVTATDTRGSTARHTFESGDIGPGAPLRPPSYVPPPDPKVPIPSLQLLRGQSVEVDLGGYFEGYRHQLSFEATSSSPDSVEVSVSDSTLTLEGVDLGWALVHVTATTPGGSTTQEFKVVVDPPMARSNSAPSFEGIHYRRVIPQGAWFSLDPSPYFADPEGDALTYTAERGSPVVIRGGERDILVPPGAVQIRVTSRGRIALTGTRPGFVRVRITATDPGGLPVNGGLIVEVTPPVRR